MSIWKVLLTGERGGGQEKPLLAVESNKEKG